MQNEKLPSVSAKKPRWGGQCLTYAAALYTKATGVGSSGNVDAKAYWNNSTPQERKMHLCAPSVAIWFNGKHGHAGFISKIDPDGTIHFTDSNFAGDETVRELTFSDPSQLGKRCPNFKGYVQRTTTRWR